MKYVMFENKDGHKTALIFPNHIPHKNMTGDVPRMIRHFSNEYGGVDIGEPVSAGFVGPNSDFQMSVWGSSESLGLKSDPGDSRIIFSEMTRSEHSKEF